MSPTDIIYTDRGHVDVVQLNSLYRLIGWDHLERRTDAETRKMLKVSSYYITAETAQARLVGFARVCGDPYVVQVLDVITHPEYRRRGIATRCMAGVLAHLQQSRYVSVTLTHGHGLDDFYVRFGFRPVCSDTSTRAWRRDAA